MQLRPDSRTPFRTPGLARHLMYATAIGGYCLGIAAPVASAAPLDAQMPAATDRDTGERAAMSVLLLGVVHDVARDEVTQDLIGSVGQVTGCLFTSAIGTAADDASTTPTAVVTRCAAPLTTIDPAVGMQLLSAAQLDRIVAILARARTAESTPTELDESTESAPAQPNSPQPRQTRPMAPSPLPATGTVTSPFGDGRNHQGIDIAAPMNAPIRAVADGEVIDAGPAQGFGLWVRIRHDDGTVTTYGHNNTNRVTVGQRVSAGQQIATIGNRGDSSGPHVHFEVDAPGGAKLDPQKWLADRRSRTTDTGEA